MAKKNKNIELADKGIEFKVEKVLYKVLRYDAQSQNIEVLAFEDGKKLGIQKIPFAHIPRSIKQKIKPIS
ncbi:MAG: hypothetical protein RBR54_08020 [Sulfurimonas sp.]|jgi:hypothetical protein|nr:hypothetical protein [Sulfurimonas sp.]